MSCGIFLDAEWRYFAEITDLLFTHLYKRRPEWRIINKQNIFFFCKTETTASEVQRKELGKEKGILGNELTRKRKGKKLCKN